MQERHAPTAILVFTTKIVMVLLFLATVIGAAPPSSVSLVYFRGQYGGNGAHLQWQTATELNTAGFRVRRASQESGPFNDLPDVGLIAGLGSATSGNTYDVIDETAAQGQTYWYRLVEIEYDNSEHELNTIALFMGATPTATIEAIPTTGDDGEEPSATATPSSTPTPPASVTASPVTVTPQPTDVQATTAPVATATVSQTATARSGGEDEARPVGDGVAEAAQPTAIGQATTGYPPPQATMPLPDSGYPGFGATTPTLAPAPTLGQPDLVYPPEASRPANIAPSGVNSDDIVGGGAEEPVVEDSPTQSSTLGRVLLWIGFVAALLIFIAGVFLSILLSTRNRERQEDVSQS